MSTKLESTTATANTPVNGGVAVRLDAVEKIYRTDKVETVALSNVNLDIAGGLPAVIITMLIQSLLPENTGGPWVIRLLPCLPADWPAGNLRGVRCRGGFETDVSWCDGVLEHVSITSLRGEPCQVEYGDRKVRLALATGETWTGNVEGKTLI